MFVFLVFFLSFFFSTETVQIADTTYIWLWTFPWLIWRCIESFDIIKTYYFQGWNVILGCLLYGFKIFFYFTVCPDGWSCYGGHCYRAFCQNNSWKDANNHCLNKNSELVSIHTPPENQLAASLLNPGSQCAWLGLRNEGINTTWTDGSLVNFTILNVFEGSGNPDVKCVAYVEQNKSWTAMSCSFQCTDFLCKRKGKSA